MLVTTRLKDAHVHICVDAQTGLGAGVPGPPNSNVGTATTLTHREEKQRLLECFIMEHSLTATNTSATMTPAIPTSTRATTMAATKSQQKNTYILSSDHSLRSRTFDSSATTLDLWGLTATIRERHGKAQGERRIRKPIGWECNDHTVFNNTVRTELNGSSGPFGQVLRLCEISSFALYVYTRYETRTKKCAGRGFTAMTKRPRCGDD